MKKVSIIVPIYNSSSYLNCCMDSLLKQTYKNIEIILVDDGSKDISPEICKKYQKKDSRVSYYSKKNGGVASARNYGLRKITGEYVVFIDSDDYIENNMIECLVEGIDKYNCDMSACYFSKFNNYNKILEKQATNDKIINYKVLDNKEEIYSLMLKNKKIGGYIWNKIYKESILHEMDKYFSGDMLEDYEFNCRYVELCSKISFCEVELYNYFENSNGLTGSFKMNDSKINGINVYNEIIKYYDKYDNFDTYMIIFHALKYEFNINYKSYKLNKTKRREYIDKSKVKLLLKSNKVPIKKKIYVFISYTFPIVSSKIKHKITKR